MNQGIKFFVNASHTIILSIHPIQLFCQSLPYKYFVNPIQSWTVCGTHAFMLFHISNLFAGAAGAARCKFFQIERQKFTISFYRSCVYTLCVISQFYTHSVLQIKSYTICVIYTECVVSHVVFSFTPSVKFYTEC